jgi:D-glycero-D-manno-heptose 1,7-bisphosphate phosphatase
VRRALFLDRDGVVNVDRGYVHRIEDFVFVDGIIELTRDRVERGWALVIVTNQAGIGRGYYSEHAFEALTAWMRGRFEAAGAPLDAVYHCPYHPEHGLGDWRRDSFDRKPNPGMLLRARDDLGLDLARSAMVGDTASDMLAARRAGVPTRVLLVHDGEAPAAGTGVAVDATHVARALREVPALIDAAG